MSPEEKELLRRSLLLSEENNKILLGVQKSLRWQAIWGVVKIVILVLPLILGYIFLQPFLGSMFNNYKEVQGMINIPEGQTIQNSTNSGAKLLQDFLNQIK
jgi:hypothetical protein